MIFKNGEMDNRIYYYKHIFYLVCRHSIGINFKKRKIEKDFELSKV